MRYTPEQQKLLRWIDHAYGPDEVVLAEAVTRNAVRVALQGGVSELLVLRQDGSIRRLREDELYAGPC